MNNSPYKFLIYLLSGLLVLAPIASIAHELEGHQEEEHGLYECVTCHVTTADDCSVAQHLTLTQPLFTHRLSAPLFGGPSHIFGSSRNERAPPGIL